LTAGRLRVGPETARALAAGGPVVALETTLVCHGFPAREGLRVGRDSEAAVRGAGAVPATVGVLDGAVAVGLDAAELERLAGHGAAARKVGARDLAACAVAGAPGATTAGGTLAAARAAGVRVAATGGLGGVHRGFPHPPDVSADLAELARAEMVVVCSGVKSILDVGATAEALESLGVPVLGWRTDRMPRFYDAADGPPVSARVETEAQVADIARAHWALGRRGALVLARPPDESLDDVDPLIARALDAARAADVAGGAVTPFVLDWLHRESGGRTLRANRELILGNATLAGRVAVALAG
jgi:pseudouridylate synthase